MAKFGKKLTELTEIAVVQTGDFLEVSKYIATNEYESRKIEFSNFVTLVSGGNGSTISLPNSANWDSTYSTVNTNSSTWDTQNNHTHTKYESVYTTVNSNSAMWALSGSSISLPQSANWDSTYTTVNSNSSNWNNVLSTVQTNSASWALSGSSISLPNSANWDSVYSTVNSNSSTWGLISGVDTTAIDVVTSVDYNSTTGILSMTKTPISIQLVNGSLKLTNGNPSTTTITTAATCP